MSKLHKRSWGNMISKVLFLTILSTFLSAKTFAQPNGEKLFKANCAACHRVDDKKLTGPGLAGVFDRVPQPANEWLIPWIKNSTKVIQSGDAYGVKIFEQYNKTLMTPMEHLSDEDILAILEYVKNPPVKQDVGPIDPTSAVAAEDPAATEKEMLLWLLGLGVVFFILINVMAGVRRALQNLVNERNGLPAEPTLGYLGSIKDFMSHNMKLVVLIVIVLLGVGSVKGYYALMEIGVYTGYAPEQPIKYSHKVHAGDNAINCVYCHHSAEKGKTAGIPSVNVCMNCHKGISEGKMYGTTEIAKIYEAAGWNPETQAYDKPQKPIKWVRIHNLPDHAYFNHSQHVIAGKQECQTCHGAVETFDYPMKQESELTMGWCINCHRETNVAMEGNEYYDKIHKELVEKYKEKGIDKSTFTVDDIGGLECAKCHY